MKPVLMVGAGVLLTAVGILAAWSLDKGSVEGDTANAGQNVFAVAEDDRAMAQARQEALSTFDAFWTGVRADRQGKDAISIKVAVPHEYGAEHLWMTGCKSADAQSFDCVVSNEPVDVALKLGSRYRFERADISDWMYRQNGRIHGGYSIRALLPTLPTEQAEAMTTMLAPLPG